MPIGDIQLTGAAAVEDFPAKASGRLVIGEKPTDKPGAIEELKDTALPQAQVETFLMEITHQPHWRREADKAADYYDGNQLSPETTETLKDRGQPPIITNLIKPTIDTVLGMEAKTRTDWRVRPEDDEVCSDDMAEALSIKLKHAEIESRADRAVSDAYAAQLKAGLGWVEVSKESDPFKCPYRVKYIHRREIFWDWRAEQPDLSDARYLIRRRWLELEHACALLPRYASLFRQTTSAWSGFDPIIEQDTNLIQSWEIERDTKLSSTDWRDTQREKVCVYEIWYRKWVRGHVMRLPNNTTVEVDFNNPRHQEAIVSGIAKVREATFQKIRLAWYCGPHFLYDVESPYRHGHFPYVPFFGYREDITGVPYGIVRAMISPQDEINARKSKMLWSLNSRRVIADADAVVDHTRAAAEVGRPDAYIILNQARKPQSQFRVEPGADLAAQQFQVLQEAKQEIAESSGIHKSMQGQQSGVTSGLAINSLVEQGLNTLAEVNDNYRFARRLVGEMLFDLVRQCILNEPTTVTVGEGRQKKVIVFNQMTQDPETGETVVINDIARVRAKVVLDDIPSTPTYRMQQLSMLTEITKSLPPELQTQVVDFVIEATDMPGRHALADRLRTVIGIKSPEELEAAAQQQQAAQQAEMQLVTQERTAKVQETMAKAKKLVAEADQIVFEQQNGGMLNEQRMQADEQMRQLQETISKLNQKVANRQQEIEANFRASIEKANIDAEAKIEAERVKTINEQMLKPLMDQITQLQQNVDAMRLEEATERKLISKDIEMVRKETATKVDELKKAEAEEDKKEEPKKEEKAESEGMAQVLAVLAQTQATLASVMAKPRKTKIIEDKDGRAIGAVSTTDDDED